MDNQRTLLLVALFFTLFLIWQKWQQQHMPTQPPATVAAQKSTANDIPSAAPGSASKATSADDLSVPSLGTDAATQANAANVARRDTAERIKVSTDVYDIEIDTFGGDVRILKLKKYPVSLDQPDNPVELMNDTPPEWYVAQSGLIGRGGEFPNHKTIYSAKADHYEMGGNNELVVPLFWHDANGVQYIKEYVFSRDHYLINVKYLIDNQSGGAVSVYPYGQLVRKHMAKHKPGLTSTNRSYTGAAMYTPTDKFEKLKYKEITEAPLSKKAKAGWVAMLEHYFTSIWILPEGDWTLYTKSLSDERYAVGFNANKPEMIEPGAKGELDMQLFAGPKDQKRMAKYGENLKLTVDYGFLTPISAPLFWLLGKIHTLVGNWGWAIILLTILIKLAFFPLSAASYKSMAKMKNLAPRMKTLKERYGDDKQKYQQAVMEFYRKEKINPMGGCLPIMVQIPVFIALYWVLLESVELRQAPWAFWIKDLSTKDPYYILPIIMGVSMFAQQRLNPPQADPMQQKIMMALPVVFTFFFLYFPAGLVLYWVVNNILSIAQQWYINKSLAKK